MKNEDLFKGSTNSILFTHKIKELDQQQEDQMIDQIIFKKYEVKKKLGKSSSIDIYEGVSIEDDKPVLIKIEPKTNEKLYLETEAYNLYTFKGFGIPELIKFGKKNNNLILIESKKGRSLYDLFVENNRKFSLNEICLIGIQCIERLKFIHSKNYIHRNIKPENFVIGLEDPHVIYLQNFYLCEKYRSSKTNLHAKFKYTKEIVGTERYGSVNALRGLRQGRRDDLESLCYMLIYFFWGNCLGRAFRGIVNLKGTKNY
jgi:serine/threonine protein kinase